ncbi:GntP family permease [Brevibacterium sp. 91QC2O2]|uniref:GntP family permease n=1 Tax=Brevibacterium TaxID=1696 RepID=UPI00211C3B1A|nr:GntP family permease [Brevibacterium sp. 91QC2O2]MCQ9385428.1 GntP family permease [Brevibacterium sp. 68QC2CO]
MADSLILINTGITIVGVIVLIIALKLHPLFALVIGALYLGLTSGLGLEKTAETVVEGFGKLMADIGMLVMFGVLLGVILSRLGAIEKLVSVLMKMSGRRLAPYALGVTNGTIMQSIFSDVILVITAPIGRNVARRIGPAGVGIMSVSLCMGCLFGLTMMIPSVGSLALSSLVGVPLPKFLLFGTLFSIVGVSVTIFIMKTLFVRFKFWKPETDEDPVALESFRMAQPEEDGKKHRLPLPLTISPVILALVLIAANSIVSSMKIEAPLLTFIGDPMVAMFLATFIASIMLLVHEGNDILKETMKKGFSASGEILALTGLGGSLAGVVKAIGLGKVLEGMFSTGAASPILLAWILAVVLHVAIGSVSVASITAAGFLAPVASSAGVDPLLIALSAAAGSLFFMTVHSNYFWMAKTMLGQTTKGATKSVSLATCVGSVVGLVMVYILAVFI